MHVRFVRSILCNGEKNTRRPTRVRSLSRRSEYVDATHSSFRWEARIDPGKSGSPTVIDAYEDSHGRLQVKLGGIVPVKKITRPGRR
jgi:hypothetical protein